MHIFTNEFLLQEILGPIYLYVIIIALFYAIPEPYYPAVLTEEVSETCPVIMNVEN